MKGTGKTGTAGDTVAKAPVATKMKILCFGLKSSLQYSSLQITPDHRADHQWSSLDSLVSPPPVCVLERERKNKMVA